MTNLGVLGPSLFLLCCSSGFSPSDWEITTTDDTAVTTSTPITTITTTTQALSMPNLSLLESLYGARRKPQDGGEGKVPNKEQGARLKQRGNSDLVIRIPKIKGPKSDLIVQINLFSGDFENPLGTFLTKLRQKGESDDVPKEEGKRGKMMVKVKDDDESEEKDDDESQEKDKKDDDESQEKDKKDDDESQEKDKKDDDESQEKDKKKDKSQEKDKKEDDEKEKVKPQENEGDEMTKTDEEENETNKAETEATTTETTTTKPEEENETGTEATTTETTEPEEEENEQNETGTEATSTEATTTEPEEENEPNATGTESTTTEPEEEKEEKEEMEEEDLEELPWWKTSIVYQIYPRSFMDSNGTGTGDLLGIASRADYLRDLGVGAVWLSPVFTSPMADFGYDVSNFTDIDPVFGDLQDFDFFLQEMHDRGLKVILDFVPNHTSDQHEWFLKSVQREEPYTYYYVWADPAGYNVTGDPIPPSNWLSVFRGSAWEWVEERQQFYLHQFLPQQPDLNFRNSDVREEMKNAMRFWLDRGVDGFRVDALKFLYEARNLYEDEPIAQDSEVEDPLQYEFLEHTLTVDQPETFDALAEWRDLLNEYEDRFLMAEVYADVNETMKYYGNETHPLADFPFNFRLIDSFQSRDNLTGESVKAVIDEWMLSLPEGKWPNWVIGNHDNSRVASRLGSDLVDAFNMMTLLLPGTPVVYYGEEIGMWHKVLCSGIVLLR
ncbi:maltase A2-like [Penaeus japonicus]|uniref:maltase A2-like n=1 Tax=Penaeus japonicus TaxID=27405 RepID=UPI001C70C29C|nr:maltase A2-like [Penaeus japonicus]